MSANINTRGSALEYDINKIYRFCFNVAVASLRRSKDWKKKLNVFIHFDCYWTAPPVRAQIPPSSGRTVNTYVTDEGNKRKGAHGCDENS